MQELLDILTVGFDTNNLCKKVKKLKQVDDELFDKLVHLIRLLFY